MDSNVLTTGIPVVSGLGEGGLVRFFDDGQPVRLIGAQVLNSYGYRTIAVCDGTGAIAVFAPRGVIRGRGSGARRRQAGRA